jgi:hypothetical protein
MAEAGFGCRFVLALEFLLTVIITFPVMNLQIRCFLVISVDCKTVYHRGVDPQRI